MKYPTPGKLTAQHLTPDQIRVVDAACAGLLAFNQRALAALCNADVRWPDRAAVLVELFVFTAASAVIGTDQADNQFSDPDAFAAFARDCFAQATLAGSEEETRQ